MTPSRTTFRLLGHESLDAIDETPFPPEHLHSWPPFPLLASTQFCMEVLLRGSVLDLQSACEVLTFDPCALLRIFAATAQEFANPEDRPERLDECIVALGTNGLVRALQHTASTWQQQTRLSAFAEHGVALGRRAQTAAAALGLCPETAYLLGLLHEIGKIPVELGWIGPPATVAESFARTAWLTVRYKLPPDLRRAILCAQDTHHPSSWSVLLQAAYYAGGKYETFDPAHFL